MSNTVVIDYTNWRGERRERLIRPGLLAFEAANPFHGAAWILDAYDLEKGEHRGFAMASIHSWREAGPAK